MGCHHESARRRTDTQTQTDFIICPMLYAIALGQIIITLNHVTNVMSPDAQWLQSNLPQSNLPVKDSGLELRQVDSLALPTFLSAAASTISLQDSIFLCSQDSFLHSYLHYSPLSSSIPIPPASLLSKQSFSDRMSVLSDLTSVEDSLADSELMTRYLAAATPNSGDWLLVLVTVSCG